MTCLLLIHINYCIDEYRKVNLLTKHYPSQVEESYLDGVFNRTAQLKEKHRISTGVERIFRIG